MTTQINQLTELTSTSDGDLLLIRENATGVDKKMQASNLRAKATTKDDVGLGNVDNVSAANLRDRSTHTGTQPLSTISDSGTMASQNANSVNIDGGTIDGTAVNATTLTASGDVNFDSGTLFVDASENRVGIGTVSPSQILEIRSDAGQGTTPPTLRITNSENDYGSGAVTNVPHGAIEFYMEEGSAEYPAVGAAIKAINTNNFGIKHALAFYTTDGFVSNTPVEAMRIDSSGNVGIGTTSPSEKLDIAGSLGLLGARRLFTKNVTAPHNTETTLLTINPNSLEKVQASGLIYLSVEGEDKDDGRVSGHALFSARFLRFGANAQELSPILTFSSSSQNAGLLTISSATFNITSVGGSAEIRGTFVFGGANAGTGNAICRMTVLETGKNRIFS